MLTTEAGAKRLGGHAEGLAPWDGHRTDRQGRPLVDRSPRRRRVTARPGSSRCPATSSASSWRRAEPAAARSISAATPSGSTASPRWRGVSRPAWCCRSPARRKPAARSISPWTPTTPSRPRAPFPDAVIVPLHTDGWAHFRQNARRSARLLRYARLRRAPAHAGARRCDRDRAVARRVSGDALQRKFLPIRVRNRIRSGSLSRRLDPGMADRNKPIAKNHHKSGPAANKPALKGRAAAAVSPARSSQKSLGPGLITGASDDDPSGIGTYSQAGAQLGYGIGWTMLLTFPLMAAIQEISARVGRVTGHGISGNVCRHYPVVAAQCRGGAAVHRQHHQHRRRSRRHGGCDQAADRRARHHLCACSSA